MRIISIVIYNFSPLPSVIFSAGGAENDYLYLRGAVFLPPAAAKTLANLQSANYLYSFFLIFFSIALRIFMVMPGSNDLGCNSIDFIPARFAPSTSVYI